jgi:hypothetical protein
VAGRFDLLSSYGYSSNTKKPVRMPPRTGFFVPGMVLALHNPEKKPSAFIYLRHALNLFPA